MSPQSSARMQSRWTRALPVGALAAAVGIGSGLLITGFVGAIGGRFILWLPLFFGAVCGIGGYVLGALAIEGAGDLVARIHGGGRVGTKREYSEAQALAATGRYGDAMRAYRAAAAEHPDDPQPLLLGARVLRDHLDDPAGAAEWFRRARAIPRTAPAQELTAVQELVELYTGTLEEPERALPELARVVDKYPHTRSGEWARRRLVELRTRVWEDVTGGAAASRAVTGPGDTERP